MTWKSIGRGLGTAALVWAAGCNNFSALFIENDTPIELALALEASAPISWRFCEEESLREAEEEDPFMVGIPAESCVVIKLGEQSCADDEIGEVQSLRILQNAVLCLEGSGRELERRFSGNCNGQVLTVTNDDCQR
ncbi:MAG: hypothetical protein AAGF12_24125 [Myxococcota bacterium]